jgi:putative transposase
MKSKNTMYKWHRFPPEIIHYAVWLYHRFNLSRRDGKAAKRFVKRLLKKYHDKTRIIVTDKLRGYRVAHRELIPDTIHDSSQYANNRAELSHQPTRVRAQGMRKFKSMEKAHRDSHLHMRLFTTYST